MFLASGVVLGLCDLTIDFTLCDYDTPLTSGFDGGYITISAKTLHEAIVEAYRLLNSQITDILDKDCIYELIIAVDDSQKRRHLFHNYMHMTYREFLMKCYMYWFELDIYNAEISFNSYPPIALTDIWTVKDMTVGGLTVGHDCERHGKVECGTEIQYVGILSDSDYHDFIGELDVREGQCWLDELSETLMSKWDFSKYDRITLCGFTMIVINFTTGQIGYKMDDKKYCPFLGY